MSTLDLDRLPPIQRTLAIPLVGRARAAELFPRLGFADPAAARIVERLRFAGLAVVARDRKIVWGSILRTQAFDEVAAQHAAEHPGATALSLGVGLCTRAPRFAGLRWVEADVPAIVDAREALLPDPDARRLRIDLGEPDALDRVLDEALDDRPTLVLAEGLLMFLAPEAQRRVLARLDARLPSGSRVVFDYLHPIIPKLTPLHGSIRATGARYRSGFAPRRDLRPLRRLRPAGLHRFEARLTGGTRALQRALTFLARSPLYDIACLEVPA